MLIEVEAIRFDRAMATGKTKPILVACERSTGEEIEVVAKFTYGCNNSPEALVREAIAAILAKDLGLPVPEPYQGPTQLARSRGSVSRCEAELEKLFGCAADMPPA
ncbi:MAG: hypothetical protein WA174_07955 [Rhodoferax sp.]